MLSPSLIEESLTEQEKHAAHRARRAMLGVVAFLASVAVVGAWLAFNFVADERAGDIQQWQVRLGIVADSRSRDVSTWLDEQFATLRDLAQNASLQMYVEGLTASAGAADTATVEGGYLRNLLTATAQRDGFIASRPKTQINANVAATGTAGLALLDTKGQVLIATAGMPALSSGFTDAMAVAMHGKPGLVDIQLGAEGLPVIGFVMPIYSVQGDPGVSPHIGFVVGMKEIGDDFLSRLQQPGDVSKTSESYLIRGTGDEINYLTPLADGADPLRLTLSKATPNLADAFALGHPGGFSILRDYRGHDVLFVSRHVEGTPWVLVRKIDRSEALGSAEHRLEVMLTTLLVSVAAATAIAFALWRQGASVRLAKAMSRISTISETMRRTNAFLQTVTDAQPTAIAVVDTEGRYRFVNRKGASDANGTPAEILGKTISEVLGPHKGKLYGDFNQVALTSDRLVAETQPFEGEPPRIVRSTHIPLKEGGKPEGVLMVEEDVTDLVRERERAENAMEALVTTLVTLLDSRVPYSSNHSARVAILSKAITEEMGGTPQEVRTAEVAGELINIGKLVVPREILIKNTHLTDQEREIVRRSLLESVKILEQVDFDIPVAEALSQVQEHWNGSGYPNGLKGDAIMLPARAITLANAFVGMTSPRSFRQAMSYEDACGLLLKEADTQYDRRAVAALINYLFNKGGVELLHKSLAQAVFPESGVERKSA